MADGAVTYTVTVDAETAERVAAAARDAGVAPERYVEGLILDTVEDGWPSQPEDTRRHQREQAEIAMAEYDRTGVAFPLEDALARFDSALEEALAAKR